MKRFITTTFLIISAFNPCFGVGVDLTRKERVSPDQVSLLPKRERKPASKSVSAFLSQLKDEDVFISIEGGDSLTWGSLREWIGDRVNRVEGTAGMRAEGFAALRDMVFQEEVSKTVQSFLNYALIAKEAKRLGIVASDEKIAAVREKWLDTYRKSGAAGASKLAAAGKPDSYFGHQVTNSVLWQAYADAVVLPTLNITEDDVAGRIAQQERTIADAVATNAAKRAFIYEILKKVKYAPKAERMSFAEAAEEWTDDYNGDTGGVFVDDDEKPREITDGDLIRQVEEAYKRLQPGEISDVVETPFSWHIVKLINRNLDDAGDVESVNVAHIMLEKVPMPPVLTAEQARHKLTNAKLRIAMAERYVELLQNTKVNCVVPLFGNEQKAVTKQVKRKRRTSK